MFRMKNWQVLITDILDLNRRILYFHLKNFGTSFAVDLLEMHSPNFCLFEKVIISFSFRRRYFLGVDRFFFFSTLKRFPPLFSVLRRFYKNSAVNCIFIFLYIMLVSSPSAGFLIFSLSLA